MDDFWQHALTDPDYAVRLCASECAVKSKHVRSLAFDGFFDRLFDEIRLFLHAYNVTHHWC